MTTKEAALSAAVVYVLDDDEGMRRALSSILATIGFRVVAYAVPSQFLAQHDASQHSCLILDIRMPEMSGLQVQQQLNKQGSMLPVIFITGHADVPMAVQAMKEGAFDFLEKPFREQDLVDRINDALQQDAENRKAVLRLAELRKHFDSLSQRERQVLELIVDGRANKVIATDLNLSERTVEIHRAAVLEKMGARSIAHLVKIYLTLNSGG
jgi:two-component system, LuxR family, response regulator FixJ